MTEITKPGEEEVRRVRRPWEEEPTPMPEPEPIETPVEEPVGLTDDRPFALFPEW